MGGSERGWGAVVKGGSGGGGVGGRWMRGFRFSCKIWVVVL